MKKKLENVQKVKENQKTKHKKMQNNKIKRKIKNSM